MRKLIWGTSIVVVLGIIAAIIFTPKSDPTDFDYASLPVLGQTDAPVKIVEFGDFKCPACQYFSQQVKPQLEKEYIDTGKAAMYFMDFLIIGPDSETAALAAHSVFHQNNDAFWKYYDALYKNQPDEKLNWATPDYLLQLAKDNKIDVDYDKMKTDIEDKTYIKEVDKGSSTARKANVQSTPTLFINGKEYKGDFSNYGQLKEAIDKALAADKAE
ncbi:thioredoxin domain-containing protein [Paenibacillus rhizovicinus]|uniref:Thioredoxin domain-containing protein n=2 Tax=Paenibacillus rhizovicinus TaxID=2704463 RepID=A0A6C0PAG8_9BACL|nr:thioredoxin domain-containing protein [Paenibacillus rhizovicinus]